MARNGTKRDEMIQEIELTPEQEAAIVALLAGDTDEAAAAAAGVNRSTLARWKASDAGFVAAYNARRREAWEASLSKIRAMISKAVDVVNVALDSDDERVRLAAAWKLLQVADLDYADVRPSGATTAAGVQSDWNKEAMFNIRF